MYYFYFLFFKTWLIKCVFFILGIQMCISARLDIAHQILKLHFGLTNRSCKCYFAEVEKAAFDKMLMCFCGYFC